MKTMDSKKFEKVVGMALSLTAARYDHDEHPESYGAMATEEMYMDLLIDAIRDAAKEEVRENPCPYTFSHTRHWCGYADCRDSR